VRDERLTRRRYGTLETAVNGRDQKAPARFTFPRTPLGSVRFRQGKVIAIFEMQDFKFKDSGVQASGFIGSHFDRSLFQKES